MRDLRFTLCEKSFVVADQVVLAFEHKANYSIRPRGSLEATKHSGSRKARSGPTLATKNKSSVCARA